jgi:LmbE family N-acetylglucosaminyl deacetylase
VIREALLLRSAVVIAAHPDDETIGAAGLMPSMRKPVVVHVTDGAPRHTAERAEYAELRRAELLAALETAGIEESQTRTLDFVDQEASLDMAAVTRRIAKLLAELRPGAVLTHPYEGGHPDHDATAFAVHSACAMQPLPVDVYEFTSYHTMPSAGSPSIETGRFLPGQDEGEAVVLDETARRTKSAMMRCFASQEEMLRQFAIDVERFRRAPVYDFTQPPHAGKLFYENFDWGMTGERWRALAQEAKRAL